MSDKLESNSSQASYHLQQLTKIISEWPKDIELLREENQLINNKYKQLEEKYSNLLNNYQNLEQKYEQLEKRFENNNCFDSQIECHTDFDHNLDDDNCLMPYEKTFIGENRKSDVLCDESTCGSTDGSIDADFGNEVDGQSVDEIPDSLDSSQRDLNDFEDNDCVIVEEKLSHDSLDEVPDSLTNSPIVKSEKVDKKSKNIENEFKSTEKKPKSIENKPNLNNICNYFKVKEEKCDKSIDRNTDSVREEKVDKSIDNRNDFRVKEEKRETIHLSIDKLIDVKTEKCEKSPDLRVKTEKNQIINNEINVKSEKKENNDSSSGVKFVVKTLGPVVRKKDERKKLNGYMCKV